MKTDAKEFYLQDFSNLVQRLGLENALAKVQQYQREPYANIPCVRNGLLLQTFNSWDGSSVIIPLPIIPIANTQGPELNESEFSDVTDVGVWQPNKDNLTKWKSRQNMVRRSKQYA